MRFLLNAITGAMIGMTICTIIIALTTTGSISIENLRQQLLISSMMGAFIGLFTHIFMMERFPMIVALILHFIATYMSVLVAGYMGHWYVFTWLSFGFLTFYFVVIYSLIWLFQYQSLKRQVYEVNEFIRKK